MIAGHLLCVVLLFVYVSRRVDRFLALLAAALLLFLGPGWQNILWPFQIAWLISLACGIGMLLALDRRDRVGDVVACLLLLISICSSGIGLPFLVGAAFELLWRRERRREIWVVAIPLLVYVIWALAYQTDTITRHAFVEAPSFIAAAAAAALAALIGLAGDTVRSGGSSALTWGTPLAVAGAALLAWRLARIVRIPDRALTLMVTLGVFWILIAIGRSDNIAHGYDSRYVYVGVLLILLLAAELAAGVRCRSSRVCRARAGHPVCDRLEPGRVPRRVPGAAVAGQARDRRPRRARPGPSKRRPRLCGHALSGLPGDPGHRRTVLRGRGRGGRRPRARPSCSAIPSTRGWPPTAS